MSINNAEKLKNILFPNEQEVSAENGVVIVGANGSGKTRLGNWIDTVSPQKNIKLRISAQKVLNFPEISSIALTDEALADLICGYAKATSENFHQYKMGQKWGGKPATYLSNDYGKLLAYLFSEHNDILNEFYNQSREAKDKIDTPTMKLSIVQKIWEEILPDRKLTIKGVSILVKSKADKGFYNAAEMSDGERVVFYLIGQCLSVHEYGILIVDEPEIHLHKSIQYALWDRIESERNDCLFVYLTHDVEFAASRANMTKIWLKQYDGKEWIWKIIEKDIDLPEELLLGIYGSRKKVLLIEGQNGSQDVQFYRHIFKDFLVRPCGSCENVITYVKAFKKSREFHQLEIYGLIDKDRRLEQEIMPLEDCGVFTLKVAEIENIFAAPEMLKIVAEHMQVDFGSALAEVKKFVFKELNKELERQISDVAFEEIRHKLMRADLKGNTKDELNQNYLKLTREIDCNSIYETARNTFEKIIGKEDYIGLLKYYNRKSISSRIGFEFRLKKNELPALLTKLASNEQYKQKITKAIEEYIPAELFKMI